MGIWFAAIAMQNPVRAGWRTSGPPLLLAWGKWPALATSAFIIGAAIHASTAIVSKILMGATLTPGMAAWMGVAIPGSGVSLSWFDPDTGAHSDNWLGSGSHWSSTVRCFFLLSLEKHANFWLSWWALTRVVRVECVDGDLVMAAATNYWVYVRAGCVCAGMLISRPIPPKVSRLPFFPDILLGLFLSAGMLKRVGAGRSYRAVVFLLAFSWYLKSAIAFVFISRWVSCPYGILGRRVSSVFVVLARPNHLIDGSRQLVCLCVLSMFCAIYFSITGLPANCAHA